MRVHEHQFDPTGRGGPGEQQSDKQQRHGGTALSEDVALPDEKCRQGEEALVTAPHGERRGAYPAQPARMGKRLAIGQGLAEDCWSHGSVVVGCTRREYRHRDV